MLASAFLCIFLPALKLQISHLKGIDLDKGFARQEENRNVTSDLTFGPPFFKISSKIRSKVTLVLGIPTVRRESSNYLLDTLTSLFENMSPEESSDCLVIVFLAEMNKTMAYQIMKQFPEQISSGLLEVIGPPLSGLYPDFNTLERTFGDGPARVRWRSKQNLDYAFLMTYSKPKGTYYVQLEEDVITKPNFTTMMKDFAQENTKKQWFLLDFCTLGFIAKLFYP